MQTRVDARAETAAATRYGDSDTPCARCERLLGPEERFCAGCGQLRPGLDPKKYGRIESKSEAAWREVQEQLRRATVGRYHIVRELGRGGMAAVYLATEEKLKRTVAIKVMRPSFVLDEGMVERFMREARTMASLSHPNIVSIHSVEEVDQLYFFVMQFVPGLSLEEVIRRAKQLPVAAVQAIIFQAAAALGYAHRQPVVHRDIKPANIMLDHDGNALVTDFGIAKVADVQATAMTVGPMGTPLYMSPEQCAGGTALTPASDQYSLGNVAYELLTGQPPFVRPTAMALGVAIMSEKPRPIREFRNDVPPDIEGAVLKMLAKEPKDRFPNLAEASAAIGGESLADDDPIREYLRGLARQESRHSGRHLTPKASRSGALTRGKWTGYQGTRFRRWILLGGFGGLAVVSFGGYFLFVRKPSPRPPVVPPPGPAQPSAVLPPPVPSAVAPPPPVEPANAANNAAEVRRLMAIARRAADRRDWPAAAAALAQAGGLDPGNVEIPALTTRVARGRLDDSVRTAVAAANPGGPPPPQPAPLPTPTPAPSTPSADSGASGTPPVARRRHDQEIRLAIDGYLRAINGRSLERIRAIYPGLTGDQEEEWRGRFARDVKRVVATASVRSIDEGVSGTEAVAVFVVSLRIEPAGGDPLDFTIRCDAVLKDVGGTWRIVTLVERGA